MIKEHTNRIAMAAAFLADGYKLQHHLMYPRFKKDLDGRVVEVKTVEVYNNLTPRSNKYAPKGCTELFCFGSQMSTIELNVLFHEGFFKIPKHEIIAYLKEELSLYTGGDYDVTHLEELYDLGHLPIEIKSLPEGTLVPMGVPVMTVRNTLKSFFWLPNFIETIISQLVWKGMSSASVALLFRRNLTKWALKTDRHNSSFVRYQGHDFSMRGLDSLYATYASGLGHAISFLGSDSLPVIHAARVYYAAEGQVISGASATEHSVMCAGGNGEGEELETYRRLIKDFPTGILSIVSDTWDLWYVLNYILTQLRDDIMSRDGKVVIRPDSGDPVDIICGTITYTDRKGFEIEKGGRNKNGAEHTSEEKGVVELLWDVFGGTINEQGYKILDPHIGAIYGDSITPERQEDICARLAAKGFASTNVVFGIGSFTYQFNTRDTWGFAVKATHSVQDTCELDGTFISSEDRVIFKDPITGDGMKKSAKGYLAVYKDKFGKYYLKDNVSREEEKGGELKTIFLNGVFGNKVTLMELRESVDSIVTKEVN